MLSDKEETSLAVIFLLVQKSVKRERQTVRPRLSLAQERLIVVVDAGEVFGLAVAPIRPPIVAYTVIMLVVATEYSNRLLSVSGRDWAYSRRCRRAILRTGPSVVSGFM